MTSFLLLVNKSFTHKKALPTNHVAVLNVVKAKNNSGASQVAAHHLAEIAVLVVVASAAASMAVAIVLVVVGVLASVVAIAAMLLAKLHAKCTIRCVLSVGVPRQCLSSQLKAVRAIAAIVFKSNELLHVGRVG